MKSIPFYTISGLQISKGFERIEHGGRGNYIEINADQIIMENIYVPNGKKWKLTANDIDYIEYRTKRDNVKIYFQVRQVDYANYLIGKFYVSPKYVFKTKNKTILEYGS